MTLRIALTALPFAGLLIGVFPADRVEPYVLGLPFLLFWVSSWIVLTAAIMGAVTMLDDRREGRR